MKHTKKQSKKQKPKHFPKSRSHPARDKRPISRPKEGDGVFSAARSGYGFVKIEGEENDIFIPREHTGGALHGDTVHIRYRNRYEGDKTEGEVLQILSWGKSTVIGVVLDADPMVRGSYRARPRYPIIADDARISLDLYVHDLNGAEPGDKVEVSLGKRYPGQTEMFCTLLRTFGKAETREANYAAILADCGVPVDFSKEALAQAQESAGAPLSHEDRVVRDKDIIFTIDGADAKDLDDAISLRCQRNGNYLLGVHIADVSHYVTPKSPLDDAVMERGTSLYFTDKVVPMLPVALSNGACSLNPHEEKYALSALITLSPTGDILGTKVEKSIIVSRVRGVYSEVNDLFDFGKASPFYEKYMEVYPTLMRMYKLYTILKEKSQKRGAMELERPEAKILLDKDGIPQDIVARERGDAEKLIEQFMLAANEGVATLLKEKGAPCVYRIHEKPQAEKLEAFVQYVHNLGFDASYIQMKDPTGCDFTKLLAEAGECGLGDVVSYTLLRSMAKAKYTDYPHIHFGLGIETYCHFTSPIRRLADLATHRMIKAVILDKEPKQKYASYAARAAACATETELRALTAERRIEGLYKALYLSFHIGEHFPARVTSVTNFGAFLELANTCEGMIPTIELPHGIWTFDEGNHILRSSSGMRLSLGDTVEIEVKEVDIPRGKVKFALVRILEPLQREEQPPRSPKQQPTHSGRSTYDGGYERGKNGRGKHISHPAQKRGAHTRGKSSFSPHKKGGRGSHPRGRT